MSLFGRERAATEREYRSPPLTVTQLDDAPYARQTVAFPPKPEELVEAAKEWTRPPATHKPEPPTLVWSSDAPTEPGAWWFTESGSTEVQQCEVVCFGGQLCISERRGDSVLYRRVSMLRRTWAKANQ